MYDMHGNICVWRGMVVAGRVLLRSDGELVVGCDAMALHLSALVSPPLLSSFL